MAPTSPPNDVRPLRWLVVLALLAALSGVVAPRPAAAQVTEAQVRATLAAQYGVEVLRIRPAERDGRAVFLVTVMKPGGNTNDAFQVSMLAVDRDTGALVPAFRHTPSGVEVSGAPSWRPNRQPTDALERGWNWR